MDGSEESAKEDPTMDHQQTQTNDRIQALVPLSDTELAIRPEEDIRGRTALDAAGEEVGNVDELLVEPSARQVRFLRLKGGGILGIGDSTWLVPVEAIRQVGEDAVRLDRSGAEVGGGPTWDPDLERQPEDYYGSIYGYYGYPPFWGGWPSGPRA
jgi:sporulation protein YlmC with PRC-barrel domain